MPKVRNLRLKNSAAGSRYVHADTGQVVIAPGETTPLINVLEADLADLPEGLAVVEDDEGAAADAAQGPPDGEGHPADVHHADGQQTQPVPPQDSQLVIPADLADNAKADGIVARDKLIEVAKAEDVKVESDDNKAQLVTKIAEARAAKAAPTA